MYNGWGWCQTITINTTNSGGGANVSTTQNNFPLLLRLTTSNFDFSRAKSDLSDLRFSYENDKIPYQIEDVVAGESAIIWVSVPTILGNSHTRIKMYYGNSSAISESSGPDVFDPDFNFQGVWHLNEAGNVNKIDSTGNGRTGAPTNMVAGDGVDAYINGGQSMTSASSKSITMGSVGLAGSAARTISAWVRPNSTVNWSTSFGFTAAASADTYFDIERIDAVGSPMGLHLYGTQYSLGVSSQANTWMYISATRDGTSIKAYLNGAEVVSATKTISTEDHFVIGRRPQSNTFFTQVIDEVRVDKVARSADWIKLCYETEVSNSQVLNYSERYPAYHIKSRVISF